MNLKYDDENEYDPKLEFAQFLKEAKTHACQEKFVASEEAAKETKAKKSWKSSIFPWLKADKKSGKIEEYLKGKSNTRRGYASGPVNGINGCIAERPKRSNSFNQRTRMDMPYITLGQFNSSRDVDVRSYGPVYLVT